jgi:predicted nucleic acid-binding protein
MVAQSFQEEPYPVILIDADICIEILCGNRKVIKKSSQYDGVIAVSFMTVGELHYGVHN